MILILWNFFLWRAEDKATLGVGAMLYMNFLRWLVFLFLLMGLVSTVSVVRYAGFGAGLTTLDFTEGDVLEYLALSTSASNFGSYLWSPGGYNYCSGKGFAAMVCSPGGWKQSVSSPSSSDPYEYACGQAPDNLTSSRSLTRYLLTGGLNVPCTTPTTMCYCYPGYGGDRCATLVDSTAASAVGGMGFCVPPSEFQWWGLPPGSSARADARAAAAAHRKPSMCSGRGSCQARVSPATPTTLLLTFCSCDTGHFGPNCEFIDAPSSPSGNLAVHGSILGQPRTKKDASQCPQRSLPYIDQRFGILTFNDATCKDHGFGVVFPTLAGGLLNISNAFRTQTPGVCFCEPGYSGEECLGGAPLTEAAGIVTTVYVALFFMAFFVLYRTRKHAEQSSDDATVSPSDFTLFVDKLPDCTLRRQEGGGPDVEAIKAHFSQWGPVHAVQPGVEDEAIFYLQRERNAALLALHILGEKAAHKEGAGGDAQRHRSGRGGLFSPPPPPTPALPAFFTSPTLHGDPASIPRLPIWMPRLPPPAILTQLFSPSTAPTAPLYLPPLPTEAGVYEGGEAAAEAASAAALPPLTPSQRQLIKLGQGGAVCTPAQLAAHVLFLDGEVARALQDTSNFKFNRAFVTFKYSSDTHDCLDMYTLHKKSLLSEVSEKAVSKISARSLALFTQQQPPQSPSFSPQPSITTTTTTTTALPDSPSSPSPSSAPSWRGAFTSKQSRTQVISQVSLGFRHTSFRGAVGGAAAPATIDTTAGGAGGSMSVFKVSVKQACEPDEVLWDSLDTGAKEFYARNALTILYMLALSLGLFYFVVSFNSQTITGWRGFGVAGAVVVINFLVGKHWALVAELEQHYTVGSRKRSIYFKTLITQCITTILGGAIGVYGLPSDTKNGFIRDWCQQAGGFVLRSILIESIVPPIVSLINPSYRIAQALSLSTTSFTHWALLRTPPTYRLELRSAALMRSVILVCIFNAGLPILNYCLSACMLFHYISDMYTWEHLYRVQREGAELPRALEFTLGVAGVMQATCAWLYFGFSATGEQSLLPAVTFLVFVSFLAWAVLGYFSYKYARGRDCCFGAFTLQRGCCRCRCRGITLSSSVRSRRAAKVGAVGGGSSSGGGLSPCDFLRSIHENFMRLLFGVHFFAEDFKDLDDETEGKAYGDLCSEVHGEVGRVGGGKTERLTYSSFALMHHWPYRLPEREQVFPEQATTAAEVPIWTAAQLKVWLVAEQGKTGFTGGEVGGGGHPGGGKVFPVNPLATMGGI